MLSLFTILSSLQTELHPWLPHDLCGHTPSPPAEGWDDGHSQDGSWTLTSRHFFGWNCQLLNIPVRWFGPVSVLLRYVTKEVMALWKNDGIKWSQIRSHLSQTCDASICHPRLHLSRSMLGLINVLFFTDIAQQNCAIFDKSFRMVRFVCQPESLVQRCWNVPIHYSNSCEEFYTLLQLANIQFIQVFYCCTFPSLSDWFFGNFERLRTNSYIWKLWKIEIDNEWYF